MEQLASLSWCQLRMGKAHELDKQRFLLIHLRMEVPQGLTAILCTAVSDPPPDAHS